MADTSLRSAGVDAAVADAPIAANAVDAPATAASAASTDQRSFDLSLRLLTVLVLIALAGSVAVLVYRWAAPRLAHDDATRTAVKSPAVPAAVAPPQTDAAKGDEVLMDPHQVFRCEEQGRVTFSDRNCEASGGASPAPRGR